MFPIINEMYTGFQSCVFSVVLDQKLVYTLLSTVGSRFTTGLHSRMFGHKSNCCKTSTI